MYSYDKETYLEWLKTIEPGDQIAIVIEWFGEIRDVEFASVDHVTPKGKIAVKHAGATLVFRSDGRELKDYEGWRKTIRPITKNITMWKERKKLSMEIGATNFRSLSLDALRDIKNIIDQSKVCGHNDSFKPRD